MLQSYNVRYVPTLYLTNMKKKTYKLICIAVNKS